jgi:hypothetical protein
MAGDLRLDEVMKSIDVLGRLAYGGQCVAAMMILAAPVLFVTASTVFAWWNDAVRGSEEDAGRAALIYIMLIGFVVAAATGAFGVLLAGFCWRWSGDWITEWPGYAVGFAIAGLADGALALLLTSTPLDVYVSFLTTIVAAFVAGVLVAGKLAGAGVLVEQRQQRELVRRR